MPQDKRLHSMQFTGLHDKNGKEIYEGDILRFAEPKSVPEFHDRYYTPIEPLNAMRVVTFDIEGSAFRCDGTSLDDCLRWHECEIVGNTRENPELRK